MGLRPYQVGHFQHVRDSLLKYRTMLDASDTGTGKTYVALYVCQALGVVPLVVGPKSSRAGWEKAAALVGIDIEFTNYEKLRGRRVITRVACPVCPVNGKPYQGPFIRKLASTEWIEEKPHGQGTYLRWKNNYAFIILDEAHRCGGSTALNSKVMIAAKRQAEYVLALSATAADDPRQMKALGYLLGLHGLSKKELPSRMTWMDWQLRHGCTPGAFGGFDFSKNDEKQAKAFRKLNAELFPRRAARMRKAEIPGFPKTVVDVKLLYDDTGRAAQLADDLHEFDTAGGASLVEAVQLRRKLELLKVPHFVDLAQDYALTSKVVVFLNFTDPLFELFEKLKKEFGNAQVGYISGTQTGKQGEAERRRFLDAFQANKLTALVVNAQAGGESANMHDPTGQVERTTLISPLESGRQFQQVLGRVNRDGGAWSLQLVTYFAGTREEIVADRMKQKGMNIDLLNDADLLV